jgi:hypothetical protein
LYKNVDIQVVPSNKKGVSLLVELNSPQKLDKTIKDLSATIQSQLLVSILSLFV